ncbi:MAG: hypothetical protein LBL05_10065 [Synergistaceae bacterium]|nr:hypothetical protein [Synergistaceae bacterium]
MMKISGARWKMAVLFLLACCAVSPAYGRDAANEIERVSEPRTAVCWFEGDAIGDVVVNARGRVIFLYMDSGLAAAFSRQKQRDMKNGPSSSVPPHLTAYASKYGSKKKHVLFVASVKALKRWDFDTEKLSVAGYSPAKDDVLTGVTGSTLMELRPGVSALGKDYEGYVGFFVPADRIQAGTEIKIGYGADLVGWKVPAR